MNKSLIQEIAENRENFLKGILNYAPIKSLGKFTEWYPGWMMGDVSCLTAVEAAGKTSFSKEIIEHSVIPWAIKNNKNLHVIRFGLEESKKHNILSLLSHQLYVDYKVEYNIKDFLAIGRVVEEKHLPWIKESEEKINTMFKYLTYEDSTYNSLGIWKKVRNFAANRGTFLMQGNPIKNLEEDWNHYVPNDPQEMIIIVVDNLTYITPDKEEVSPYRAVWNTVENLRKYAANKLNYAVVILQHQDATSENQESRKEKQILPTVGGISIHKGLKAAYLNMIGIANANKANVAGVDYAIRNWDGHDLKHWGDYTRTINVLKSRYGVNNCHTTLANFGRCGVFEEIPSTGTQEYKEYVNNLKNYK